MNPHPRTYVTVKIGFSGRMTTEAYGEPGDIKIRSAVPEVITKWCERALDDLLSLDPGTRAKAAEWIDRNVISFRNVETQELFTGLGPGLGDRRDEPQQVAR
jgi:hypothetical protein